MRSHRRLPSGSAGVSRQRPLAVEQPAVKRAAQPAILEPAERQVGAAMRDSRDRAGRAAGFVAEQDQILAQHPHRAERPLGGQFLGQRDGLPIKPLHRAARRTGADPHHPFILLGAHHRPDFLPNRPRMAPFTQGKQGRSL